MSPSTAPDRVADWLRLAALNLTAAQKNALLDRFESPAGIFAAEPAAWAEAGFPDGLRERVRLGAGLDVRRDVDLLAELEVELVERGELRYPALLKAIPDPPPVLFWRGQLPPLGANCVALVGTRRASPYGELVAETLAAELAAAGVAVISGLAAGIDAAAHRGALKAEGYTAGVLGTGVDQIFPKENRQLFERLVERGGVSSEFPFGSQPLSWHFPLRNRVISGLSRAVVVVQAPAKSGALITARLALEQNREVLAVPGNITDTRQGGCHDLIRDGARLVRGVDDILEAINLHTTAPTGSPAEGRPAELSGELPELSEAEARVAGATGLTPLGIDELIEQTGLPTPEVQSALITLELKQVVQRLPGNRFVRRT